MTTTIINTAVTDMSYRPVGGDVIYIGTSGSLIANQGSASIQENYSSGAAALTVVVAGSIFSNVDAIVAPFGVISIQKTGQVFGTFAITTALNSTVTNAGEITGAAVGVTMELGTPTLNNSGTITTLATPNSSNFYAAVLGLSSAGLVQGRIVNSGTISGNDADGVDFRLSHVANFTLTTGAVSITNSGLIEGGGSTVIDDETVTFYAIEGNSLADAIINTGMIRTTNIGGVAICTYEGSDSIVNSGSIIGDVDLGTDDDSFDGRRGTVQGTVYGGAGDDTIYGSSTGDDVLDGGAGADYLNGGGGENTASYTDAAAGVTVDLTTPTNNTGDADGDIYIGIEDVTGSAYADTLYGDALANVLNGGEGANTLFGQGGNDMLTGGSSGDILDGGTGADTMSGGAGDDTYYVDNLGDRVIERSATGGNDILYTSVGYNIAGQYVETVQLTGTANINATGNTLANTLNGNAGNNVLNGLGGADTMAGGAGDDTYYVDNSGDVVTEAAGAGTDTVFSSISYTLADNVEVLTLTGSDAINGTGNALANTITGTSGANVLDGGAGADTMTGGAGDDTYYVDNASDQVIEGNNGGNDIVYTSVSYNLGSQYVEALTLTGTANINGTGDGLANTIIGNAGANVIDGGAGADTMTGGDGSDTYYVDNAGDKVIETSATGGSDLVYSSVSYNIAGQYIETLTLTGTANINATGNTQANTLNGNSGNNVLSGVDGNDVLNGGAGNDTMTGGTGADTFVFNSALGSTNIDTITDFTVGTDLIALDRSIFAAAGVDGALAASAFYAGTAAHAATDRIIYNSATGDIYYDADGNGSGAAVKFAHVTAGLSLTAASFTITG